MNKIIVSILLTIILVIGINKITDAIFYVEKPEKSAYSIQVAETTTVANTTTSETSSESSQGGDIMALFASTNAADGARVFKKCLSCHSIEKGKPNKIGPNIFGVLNRKAGSVSGYKYSKAMLAYGKIWSFEEMNGFLTKPKDWIKGTKMSFIGLRSAKDRAAVILYMNENTDNPLPLQ